MAKQKLKLKEIISRFPKEAREAIKKGTPDLDKAEMERHACQTEIKALDSDRTATIYLSTRVVDRDDDIVTPDGWRLKDYLLNPVGLWAHDSKIPVVYTAEETKADEFGLMQRIKFAETPFANDLWLLVKGGFLKTFSAGFRSHSVLWEDMEEFAPLMSKFRSEWPELNEADATRCDRIILEKTLFESTICNIPSNPMALVLSLDEGKVAIEDETKEALKIEEFIKKGVDDGVLGKKFARTQHKAKKKAEPPKSKEPEAPSEPAVKEMTLEIKDATGLQIEEGLRIKEHVSQESIDKSLALSVKKAIDKGRGAV